MSAPQNTSPERPSDQLAPHPFLKDYYLEEGQRQGILTQRFDCVASEYEWISQLLSFGSGRWYREKALREAGLTGGMKVLDVACGPGTVSHCAKNLVGRKGCVVGLDPSTGMLHEARRNTLSKLVQGFAEDLPFSDSSFDFLSMGYALRHVSDLHRTFREYFRVLKPHGILLILEISRPRSTLQFHLTRFYLHKVVPRLALIGTRNQYIHKLMRYFWDTIENCVPPETIMKALENSGFTQPKVTNVFGGLIKDYSAIKSS